MANTLTGLLSEKITEWVTGRKIGITIGIDPNAKDGERGGELWQIPILEITGTPEVQISQYSMEYGKVYTDNMIFKPEIVVMKALLNNGIISDLASNAVLTLQDRLGKDWFKNTVITGCKQIQTLLKGNVLCDITTYIKVYKNLHLCKAPIVENVENDQKSLFITLYFQELQLFKPDTLKLSSPVKKAGSNIRKKAIKKNIPKKTQDDMRYYKIMPDGNYCKCIF